VVDFSKIGYDNYKRLIGQYSWDRFPRSFGNPKQFFVYDFSMLYESIFKNNGKFSCFTSHNTWGGMGMVGGKVLPTKIWYEVMFFDFDDPIKPENSQKDAIRIVSFLEEIKQPYIIQFSGSKGFHVFLYFTPILFDYRRENNTERNMSVMIKKMFMWFKRVLELKTLDDTVGEPKKLCRLPYTYHVNRKGEVHKEQCFPLTKDQLFDWDILKIKEHSKNPDFIIPTINFPINLSVIDFLNLYVDISDDYTEVIDKGNIEIKDYKTIGDKETEIYLEQMNKQKPCLVNGMMNYNPDHFTRVSFLGYLKRIGVSKEKFERIYSIMANKNGYIDYHIGEERRTYQINYLYDNPSFCHEPNCSTIKLKHPHLCLREKCPKYVSSEKYNKRPKPTKKGCVRSVRKKSIM
jgi:hypothetical protein